MRLRTRLPLLTYLLTLYFFARFILIHSQNGRINFSPAKATRVVAVQLSVIRLVDMLHVPPGIFVFFA